MANPLVYYLVDRIADALYPNKKIGAIGNYIDAVTKTEDANRKREAIRRSKIFQHN